MFTQNIAIDLGTANTIIIVDGQIVVDEPSVVAIRRKDETMVAVGRKDAAMIDHGEGKIYTVRPLKKGVFADYKACEMMIRGFINFSLEQVYGKKYVDSIPQEEQTRKT